MTTLGLVRLLREAASVGLPVRWELGAVHGIDIPLLVHLPAPVASSALIPDVAEWQRRHQPGLCYYRVGPGFVQIKDVRQPEGSARFRITGDQELSWFARLHDVISIEQLDTPGRALLDALLDARIALVSGPCATLLPHRMRRWPVPALDV